MPQEPRDVNRSLFLEKPQEVQKPVGPFGLSELEFYGIVSPIYSGKIPG
jgi:hypothetical protein